MKQKVFLLAGSMVAFAILALLLHPATPGVLAPTGGKALKQILLFPLVAFYCSVAVCLVLLLVRTRQIQPDLLTHSTVLRTTSLLC